MVNNIMKKPPVMHKSNVPILKYCKEASLSSQSIEKIINDKKLFELRGDSIAFKLHEESADINDDINLTTNSLNSSAMFPSPGLVAANRFGDNSTK